MQEFVRMKNEFVRNDSDKKLDIMRMKKHTLIGNSYKYDCREHLCRGVLFLFQGETREHLRKQVLSLCYTKKTAKNGL